VWRRIKLQLKAIMSTARTFGSTGSGACIVPERLCYSERRSAGLPIMEFRGVYAAAITPRGKQGEVDFGTAFELIDFLCKAGVRGIVWFGPAGEYPAFRMEERSRLVYLARKRSRVPVLASVGSATLDASVELACSARDGGVDAVLIPPPLFFRYGEHELREFFLRFARQVPGVPIVVSNTPGYTSGIGGGTAAALLKTGLFAAIEDASASLELFAHLPRSALLAGSETGIARVRPVAIISSAACAIPELVLALDRALTADDPPQIASLDEMLQQMAAWTARFPLPVILKTALEMRGLKIGPPGVPVSAETEKDLEGFREWFTASVASLTRKPLHV